MLELILEKLKVDSNLKELVSKATSIPYLDDYNPINTYWYPHPPCVVPLFVGYGASYNGIINHFFLERSNSFVELSLERGNIIERALNFKQLATYLVLRMIIIKDDLTEDIIQFAKKIGLNEYEDINQFTIDYGDYDKHFDKLVHYKDNLPLSVIKNIDEYKGDFPSSYNNINEKQLYNACAYEVTEEAYNLIKDNHDCPPWLHENSDKKTLFANFINNNQLKEAWLTLNSKGWLLKDVATNLELLKTKANNELFSLVADNWIKGWKSSSFINGNY
jgi:hypothetical protein